MRLLPCSLGLLSLALAGCDSEESATWVGADRQVVAPVPEAPVPPPPASSRTELYPPAPARVAPEAAEVAIIESDGRTARRMDNGRLMPLARILEIAQHRVPGEVIEVELDDDDDDGPEYELEILTADGRSIEMKIDARRGVILEVEED